MTGSSAEAARQEFAGRLRELRKDAGLTGRGLATATGLRPAKISRIEHGRQNPTEDDIRTWAKACTAAPQIPELIAAHREVEQLWTEHRRNLRAGMVHVQGRGTDVYTQTRLLRVYESNVIPGIVQTLGYATAGLATVAYVHGRPAHEVEPAARAKLEMQRLLTAPTGANTYSFVIEAGALDHGVGGPAVMNGQFDFLIEVTRMPHVAFGIIPPLAARHIRPGEGFYIFDEGLVRSETWTGLMRTRRQDQIAFYVKIFGMLRGMAVYGAPARDLIEDARNRLR
ncbi:helix-turn-helix protein [Murinocardiopsis flavida]|uniref:Helix-turn-helix protein n=1 Tax=Murinocardiopsis flavida TaxID=645275 RepID=A0A2P8DG52_9ACTN|nr:helix-turn-helix transcriptional regulator [Murinocardiopsis flavida]PSK96195.1 helix-turn-helix protein [Murinocardiopsis flavida]